MAGTEPPITDSLPHRQTIASSPPVSLVGAGPGDPELLTIKAARRLSEAEIVFCDRLVGEGIADLINPAAKIVYVGKSKGEHSVPQSRIQTMMIEAARQGLCVVRLKGGDPFIFGRGGEEVEALRDAGLEVEIIPGISSALGAAASQQIPLTQRGLAQAVTFVTGHAKLGEEPDLDWSSLARANQTVVVYMGVGAAPMIADRLLSAGRAPLTPVAVIENATRDNERCLHGVLADLSTVISSNAVEGPALLIIGDVAALGRQSYAALLKEAAQ